VYVLSNGVGDPLLNSIHPFWQSGLYCNPSRKTVGAVCVAVISHEQHQQSLTVKITIHARMPLLIKLFVIFFPVPPVNLPCILLLPVRLLLFLCTFCFYLCATFSLSTSSLYSCYTYFFSLTVPAPVRWFRFQ
jgi:hypothetical protein